MPTYLDVGVVRIQGYIARTPDLRLRRGASWMLSHQTSSAAVREWIKRHPGVRLNEDAGEADGVVCLIVPEGHEEHIATALLVHLRDRLPGAELRAGWAAAPTYPEARQTMPHFLDALPPVRDFPLAYPCQGCWEDPRIDGEMCADCSARQHAGGYRTGADRHDALGTEREILETVNALTGRELEAVSGFNELAGLGQARGNHLATIAFDGNGLGAFFAALDGRFKKGISRAISTATRETLTRTTADLVTRDDTMLPVVPHVIGGDDIVVTVVADRAWALARGFLMQFGVQMAAVGAELGIPASVPLPTMSAGVVLGHAKFPYARAVQLAEETLRRAKRETKGAQAALAWLDVTEDGEQAPKWRRAFTLTELEHLAGPLGVLTRMGKSGRQMLSRQLDHPSEEETRAAALVWARRNGHSAIRVPLEELPVSDVRNLLSIARWWPL
ncbi:hypothetical protein J5X84_42910 [Streptosporangiaceae bacterium NEAU-GS5]|nr:hypothetical protein [Streptosporangiaceae bacterium NEAU-GS5]